MGELIEHHHQRSAITEIMNLVGEANAYVSRTEPFKIKADEQRQRLGTVLHILVQVVSDLNTMMSAVPAALRERDGEGSGWRLGRLLRCRDSKRLRISTGESRLSDHHR